MEQSEREQRRAEVAAGRLGRVERIVIGTAAKHRGQDRNCDALTSELLRDAFGLQPAGPIRDEDGLPITSDFKYRTSIPGYAAAHASLSRAITMLEINGLLVRTAHLYRGASGVKLTDRGLQVAAALSEQTTDDIKTGATQ